MENYGYNMLGEMLIGLGNALKDENSELRKHFRLSREQLCTLLGVIKLAASPDVQKKYIYQLAERWNVTERTIYNWIEIGILPSGHKTAHDTRLWWYADELDEAEREMIAYGYLRPKKHHRVGYLRRMIDGFINIGKP